MSEPLIYIGTYAIKSGKLEECRKRCGELVDLVETNEPRLIAFNLYLDEQGSTISVVQVHPDSASMEFHLKLISEHLEGAFDYLEATVSEQVYGTPSDSLAEQLNEWAEPGVTVTVMPVHEVGFTRTSVR
jgi:quinol monooxygenase YgiN